MEKSILSERWPTYVEVADAFESLYAELVHELEALIQFAVVRARVAEAAGFHGVTVWVPILD